jgi:hypothetical protein
MSYAAQNIFTWNLNWLLLSSCFWFDPIVILMLKTWSYSDPIVILFFLMGRHSFGSLIEYESWNEPLVLEMALIKSISHQCWFVCPIVFVSALTSTVDDLAFSEMSAVCVLVRGVCWILCRHSCFAPHQQIFRSVALSRDAKDHVLQTWRPSPVTFLFPYWEYVSVSYSIVRINLLPLFLADEKPWKIRSRCLSIHRSFDSSYATHSNKSANVWKLQGVYVVS